MEGFRDYLPVWALPREIKNENHEFASSTISRIPLSLSSFNSANICSVSYTHLTLPTKRIV